MTPIGDDLLLGALATEAAFASGWGLEPQVSAALRPLNLKGLTTRPSLALLTAALSGRYPPALVSLINSFSSSHGLAAAIRRVRNLGHTSGPAMLAGISVIAQQALSVDQEEEGSAQ